VRKEEKKIIFIIVLFKKKFNVFFLKIFFRAVSLSPLTQKRIKKNNARIYIREPFNVILYCKVIYLYIYILSMYTCSMHICLMFKKYDIYI